MLAPKRRKSPRSGEDGELFSKSQLAELKRTIRDAHDPVRYMIRSGLSAIVNRDFFYNVSEDVWTTARAEGTLFKRMQAAEAILKLLAGDHTITKVSVKGGTIRNTTAKASD